MNRDAVAIAGAVVGNGFRVERAVCLLGVWLPGPRRSPSYVGLTDLQERRSR